MQSHFVSTWFEKKFSLNELGGLSGGKPIKQSIVTDTNIAQAFLLVLDFADWIFAKLSTQSWTKGMCGQHELAGTFQHHWSSP